VLAKGYDLDTRTKYGVQDLLRWYSTTTELFGRTDRGIRFVLTWLPHVWSEDALADLACYYRYVDDDDRHHDVYHYRRFLDDHVHYHAHSISPTHSIC